MIEFGGTTRKRHKIRYGMLTVVSFALVRELIGFRERVLEVGEARSIQMSRMVG